MTWTIGGGARMVASGDMVGGELGRREWGGGDSTQDVVVDVGGAF